MKEAPSFVAIAALLGDQARATILNALMGGQALTASELAIEANITRQTASSHLGKLVAARLLSVQSQGRHRYFQLESPDVAAMLESIMGVAQRSRTARMLPGPRDPALRRARRCYDHLAGELAVEAYDSFVDRDFIRLTRQTDSKDTLALTAAGQNFFGALGIACARVDKSRRPVCRPCLDWSVRRHHLAGRLGKALLDFCYQEHWAKPVNGSRIIRFSPIGEQEFRRALFS
ncbi:MAG: winged helix-turn-helix transcriptional regulator [Gammaproteobacteria bacterium]|nr:winged helix-turn-helix transcriptional regulator [Gammaproteobacteria bacterium]